MSTQEAADALIVQDEQARRDALDVRRSFLVQAPAGSGKTELLTTRLLALLSVVDEPEQVLAITFTKLATAEMRSRVIASLQEAQKLIAGGQRSEKGRHRHAIAALENGLRRGWSLLEQPQRLNIQTIDSLCLRIAHEAPLLSRLGGQLQPTEIPRPLYALAARRTVEQLGGPNAQLSNALKQLLQLRDVSLGECERLIADMLDKRDQWLEEFSRAHGNTEEQWADLRVRHEAPLRRERASVLHRLHGIVGSKPEFFNRLLDLARWACGNGPTQDIHALASLSSVEDLKHVDHFSCMRAFLLTGGKGWRKTADKTLGFPAVNQGGSEERKEEFKQLVQDAARIPGMHEALCAFAEQPDAGFSDYEWQTIRSIFTVLLHAAAELRVVFAERSVIDFVEAGITAAQTLGDPEVRGRWSERIRHMLVDEFQDTSRRQYLLLKEIAGGWDAHDVENGLRTCFLVGDPMQSIYLFRNAELALFDEVQQNSFGKDVPHLHFHRLTLSRNFRSIAGIVEPINAMFHSSMQAGAPGAARFTPARATEDRSPENALHLHTQFILEDGPPGFDEVAAARAEADTAVGIILRHMPAMEEARAHGQEFRIGVLVRSRQHVHDIARALRDAHIPYRAVEIETLQERQEVRDLLSLVRALTHPMDRIAWLSVLRAPWCGLTLADLHTLSGSDDKALEDFPIRELLTKRIALLSPDGQLRAQRVLDTLELALAKRFSGPFSAAPNGFVTWIERTWTALGGPHCIEAAALQNVHALFRLFSTFTPGGIEASENSLDTHLEKFFAQPDPRAPEKCSVQIMTIHKAKGLGFDVVLVPGMHKTTSGSDTRLLRWMVRAGDKAERELLIAPIGSKGAKSSAIYEWIGRLQGLDDREEIHRLLYVAATRARKELHLFAAVKLKQGTVANEIAAPKSSTLLACGWNYLQQFARQQSSAADHGAPSSPIGDSNLVPFPSSSGLGIDLAARAEGYSQPLRRLPSAWTWNSSPAATAPDTSSTSNEEGHIRVRIGSLASRARGVVLHALFESLAALPALNPHRDLTLSMDHWKTVAAAMLRQVGLGRRELDAELSVILGLLRNALSDKDAQWILGRRPYALNESAWTIEVEGSQQVVRCDRVFLAGAEPGSGGEDHLWIVDYKTADEDRAGTFLLNERARYEPQLMLYAGALREATATVLPLRLALYYPALPHLLWWPA